MKYKQQELAEKIGLTQAAISNIETDSSRKPSAPTLMKLAAALEISPQWLLDGKGDPKQLPAITADAEVQLLSAFRDLSDSSKALLISAAKALIK